MEEQPKRNKDIGMVIRQVYDKILDFFVGEGVQSLSFSTLVPSKTKEDKIYTFVPLLHLSNHRKIDLVQNKHFGEINIKLRSDSQGGIKHVLEEEKEKEAVPKT